MKHLKKFNEEFINESSLSYEKSNMDNVYTVDQAIETLRNYSKSGYGNYPVYYTLGGSANFQPVTYIDEERIVFDKEPGSKKKDFTSEYRIVIGEQTW